jgi:hypothetical protein
MVKTYKSLLATKDTLFKYGNDDKIRIDLGAIASELPDLLKSGTYGVVNHGSAIVLDSGPNLAKFNRLWVEEDKLFGEFDVDSPTVIDALDHPEKYTGISVEFRPVTAHRDGAGDMVASSIRDFGISFEFRDPSEGRPAITKEEGALPVAMGFIDDPAISSIPSTATKAMEEPNMPETEGKETAGTEAATPKTDSEPKQEAPQTTTKSDLQLTVAELTLKLKAAEEVAKARDEEIGKYKKYYDDSIAAEKAAAEERRKELVEKLTEAEVIVPDDVDAETVEKMYEVFKKLRPDAEPKVAESGINATDKLRPNKNDSKKLPLGEKAQKAFESSGMGSLFKRK